VSTIFLRWASIQTSEQCIEQKKTGAARAPGALKAKPALARAQTAQGQDGTATGRRPGVTRPVPPGARTVPV
jgi:hypothetical protein